MIVRYIAISFLKWVVSFVAVALAMGYVIPSSLSSNVQGVAVWVLTSLIALAFAEWAFKPRLPVRKDVLTLMAIWLVVSCVLSMGLDIFMWGKPIFLLKAWDIKIQYALELLMVVVAARLAIKRRNANASSEGMVN